MQAAASRGYERIRDDALPTTAKPVSPLANSLVRWGLKSFSSHHPGRLTGQKAERHSCQALPDQMAHRRAFPDPCTTNRLIPPLWLKRNLASIVFALELRYCIGIVIRNRKTRLYINVLRTLAGHRMIIYFERRMWIDGQPRVSRTACFGCASSALEL